MKNYIITSSEYDITKRRLNRLYERKERLKLNITRVTPQQLSENSIHSNIFEDKMANYVAELEEIEEEIKELEEEAAQLKDDLDYMENRISNINEIKEQVFTRYFIKGEKPLEIAPKIPCGKSSVYRYIDEINKERASWEKIRKI